MTQQQQQPKFFFCLPPLTHFCCFPNVNLQQELMFYCVLGAAYGFFVLAYACHKISQGEYGYIGVALIGLLLGLSCMQGYKGANQLKITPFRRFYVFFLLFFLAILGFLTVSAFTKKDKGFYLRGLGVAISFLFYPLWATWSVLQRLKRGELDLLVNGPQGPPSGSSSAGLDMQRIPGSDL
mmetsp:Transcript_29105/g.33273  ORF Transcript_29105/g.33273 Transcript_29105/m.33273 type:complete len:181 (+) Transcript_29105:279-821(+)